MIRLRPFWFLPFAVLILLSLHCGEDSGSGTDPGEPSLAIVPDSVTIEVSSSQQFEVDYDGQIPPMTWYVEGVEGGDPFNGMITKDGLYVAPDQPSIGPGIRVTARASQDSTLQVSAKVLVVRAEDTPFITVSPKQVTIALSDSVKFSGQVFRCASEAVVWSIESVIGSAFSVGTMRSDGTYLAPASSEPGSVVLVKAVSSSCYDKSGIGRIFFEGPPVEFTIEFEHFTDSLNTGSRYIIVIPCTAASQGQSVTGLDQPGEWITVPMPVPATATYAAILDYSANPGDTIEVTISVEGCGDPVQHADFTLDEGTGMG